jgi:GT2 family glycosyltransferase
VTNEVGIAPSIPAIHGTRARPLARATARGKFLMVGKHKLVLRGVTYGTFLEGEDGHELPPPEVVERDLRAMARCGFNTLRTYTVPPRWMLDLASHAGLRVLVGIPAEYIGSLAGSNDGYSAERVVAEAVRACAGHPAVLAYSVGNEIPASLVRWYGHRHVERYLERLVRAGRAEDPDALFTYVNYPSTEYLELPFLDLVCFNVYLESEERLRAYIDRLQNIAGDRPLVMTELGLDSMRNGEGRQARSLASQIRTVFAGGCAGAFVYAWTDEWYRSGIEVVDWAFGLTRRDREPKPALGAVQRAFADAPFPRSTDWPSISVVVCTYNGARTLRQCLDGLRALDYPDYEVIVVDDGSTDETAAIARASGFRVVDDGRQGLSGARNSGLRAASGEIVAYIDDDAWPDPHWLRYLALAFRESTHVGMGGPNLPPRGDGLLAACVSNAPGNPTHVLLNDREAEHIPGCNMAFRRANLEAIGGFDVRFGRAGDDVDVCWRLRDRGWTLGFSPAAVVWHHRRGSISAFWRQQCGYGAAEALLEEKFPERYNSVGHHTWSGRVYGAQILPLTRGAARVYHGVWGRAPFQSIYQPAAGFLAMVPLMPEWFLFTLALAGASLLGRSWQLMYLLLPLAGLAFAASLLQASVGARNARFGADVPAHLRPRLRVLVAFLHLMQPMARLWGRLRSGLTPWRQRISGFAWPRTRELSIWSERGRPAERWLERFESTLRARGLPVVRGGDFDRWDLMARSGALGRARLSFGLEEHGQGRQLARIRIRPSCSQKGLVLLALSSGFAGAAAAAGAWIVVLLAVAMAAFIGLRATLECGSSMHALLGVLGACEPEPEPLNEAETAAPASPAP